MPVKKKDKKRKGKKRAAKSRRLPSAVQGLLQYIGGQDAILQQTPRPRGATQADSGDTLSRYLAAKTAVLEAARQQQGFLSAQQSLEDRFLAKREAEEAKKKIEMLSAGLKESDTEKKRAIQQQQSKIAELEKAVQAQGTELLFRTIRESKGLDLGSLPSRKPSLGSRNTPTVLSGGKTLSTMSVAPFSPQSSRSAGSASYEYSEVGSEMGSEPSRSSGPLFDFEGNEDWRTVSSSSEEYDPFSVQPDFIFGAQDQPVAAELYMSNQPTDKPIIRDKPKKVRLAVTSRIRQNEGEEFVSSGVGAAARPAAGGGAAARPPAPKPEAKKAVISAAELRDSISKVLKVKKKNIKLPARRVYDEIYSLISQPANPAEVIENMKKLGVILMETEQKV